MRRIALVALLLSSAAIADAATDPVARFERALRETKSAHARFVQTRRSALLPSPEVAKGRLWLRHPGDVRLDYETPEKLTLLKRGDSAFVHTPSLKQVQVTTARGSGVPLGWVLGSSLAEIRRSAKVNAVGDDVEIIPERALGLPWKSLRVSFGTADFPNRYLLTELGGDQVEIRLSDLSRNAGVPASRFASAWPKGTRVVALPQ